VRALQASMVLTGQHPGKVPVMGIRPRIKVLHRQPQRHIHPRRQAGLAENHRLEADMGRPNPCFVQAGSRKQAFSEGDIDLEPNERQTLLPAFRARRRHCTWSLAITYLDDSGRRTVRVNGPGDRPFALSGKARCHRIKYAAQTGFPARRSPAGEGKLRHRGVSSGRADGVVRWASGMVRWPWSRFLESRVPASSAKRVASTESPPLEGV